MRPRDYTSGLPQLTLEDCPTCSNNQAPSENWKREDSLVLFDRVEGGCLCLMIRTFRAGEPYLWPGQAQRGPGPRAFPEGQGDKLVYLTLLSRDPSDDCE